jgi:hypothetical protein
VSFLGLSNKFFRNGFTQAMNEFGLNSPSSAYIIILLFRVGFKGEQLRQALQGLHITETGSTDVIEKFACLK